MREKENLLFLKPFFLQRANRKTFETFGSNWLWQEKVNLLSLVLLFVVLLIFAIAFINGHTAPNITESISGVITSIIILSAIALIVLERVVKLVMRYRLQKYGKLLRGEISDFEFKEETDITMIKVNYFFTSPAGSLLRGTAESRLHLSNYTEKEALQGSPVIVQYIDDNEYSIL